MTAKPSNQNNAGENPNIAIMKDPSTLSGPAG